MPIGLYIHIPFCQAICHYCDFAKTANFSAERTSQYFLKLREACAAILPIALKKNYKLSTVYFGGGTPSLFDKEISELMDVIHPFLNNHAEITLEANPEHINDQNLDSWMSSGINRFSLGVQSFSKIGLKALTRNHTPFQALEALDLCLSRTPNVNVDLIFAWQGQDQLSLRQDLSQLISRKVQHVSLYGLTYEGNTVLARRQRRGVVQTFSQDQEAALYHMAREILSEHYVHEEVSNFALPGFEAMHNHLYWSGQPYIGIGVGAHGFINHDPAVSIGDRYFFPNKLNSFLDRVPASNDLKYLIETFGGIWENRSKKDWLIEMIWTGLRTRNGIDIRLLEKISSFKFHPTTNLDHALKQKLCTLINGILILNPKEWYRESAFAVEVIQSFSSTSNS